MFPPRGRRAGCRISCVRFKHPLLQGNPMRLIRLVAISLLPCLCAGDRFRPAAGRAAQFQSELQGYEERSSSGAVYVRGYTRKDGTYVAAHDRTARTPPSSITLEYQGNINPAELGSPALRSPIRKTKRVPSATSLGLKMQFSE